MVHHIEICAIIQETRKKLDSCMQSSELKEIIKSAKTIAKTHKVKEYLFVCPPKQFIKFINSK